MGFWYNKKDDEKIANLSSTNWHECNSKFEFNELGFTSDDGFYLVVANAIKFSDVNKMGEKDFTLDEQLIKFKVARKDYTKRDFKTKQDIQVVQSRTEKWLCQVLEELDATKRYKGFLHMQDGNFLDNFLTGKDMDGKDILPETLSWMKSSYQLLEEVEVDKVVNELLTMPAAKSYGGFSKGQSEKEKLNDRLSIFESLATAVWVEKGEAVTFKFVVDQLALGSEKAVYFLQCFEKLVA